jgi:hypothetical protein
MAPIQSNMCAGDIFYVEDKGENVDTILTTEYIYL